MGKRELGSPSDFSWGWGRAGGTPLPVCASEEEVLLEGAGEGAVQSLTSCSSCGGCKNVMRLAMQSRTLVGNLVVQWLVSVEV